MSSPLPKAPLPDFGRLARITLACIKVGSAEEAIATALEAAFQRGRLHVMVEGISRATAAEQAVLALSQQIEALNKALAWYEDVARSAARYHNEKRAQPLVATVRELTLDAGTRARAVMQRSS